MNKSIESVLSEIIGVPCGNVKFRYERSSCDFPNRDDYAHGLFVCYMDFNTKTPLNFTRIGSIYLSSEVSKFPQSDWPYTALLVPGKETAMITQAIADMSKVD